MGQASNIYNAKRAANLANPIADTVFKLNDDALKAAFVKIPGGSRMNGKVFLVRASGRATTGGSYTWAPGLQYTADVNAAAAATAANNTDLVTATARSIATATRSWLIRAELIWDSTSQRLQGTWGAANAETVDAFGTQITALTAIDLSLETAGFVITGIFGTTHASNIGRLDSFTLEVL